MGIDADSTGAVIDAKGDACCWLYAIGTARKGTLWETTAIPELRVQAQALAQVLIHSTIGKENIGEENTRRRETAESFYRTRSIAVY